ncbi:unnamed protein product [Ambrosiozyma monospora]|uniref:Unnamed protein product n=1 Tax=Ambrosiozyma monospora TaxID=43982 RepID=A0ACB5T8J8_AMBMO|nr:unnamed protein product [Ambrosiozyma monospora]
MSNFKLKAQVLNFQIQYKLDKNANKKSTLVYLNEIIKEYETNPFSFKETVIFLQFLKYQYFGMTLSTEQGLATLKKLSDEIFNTLNQYNFALFQLVAISELQQLLFKCKPIELIKSRFQRLVSTQTTYVNDFRVLPRQFKAITSLMDLLISIQEDNFNETKQKITNTSHLIQQIKRNPNDPWFSNFKFYISVPIRMNGSMVEVFPLTVNWMSFKEFNMLSYFYSGVSYVIKSWDGKNRTDKLFSHCHKYIDQISVGESVSLTSFEYELKCITSDYFHVFINFYEFLSDLQSDHFNGNVATGKYKYLDNFIKSYDSGSYSSQELVIYHRLLAKVYYTLGLRYQKNGDFDHAKYYYMKIRKLYSTVHNELSLDQFFNDPISITFMQSISGIGGSLFESKTHESQIYLLSSVNLLILTLQDLKKLKLQLSQYEQEGNAKQHQKTMHLMSNALKLKDVILKEELQHLSTSEDPLLYSTISILNYLNDCVSEFEISPAYQLSLPVNDSQLDKAVQIAPLLASVLYYIKAKTYQPNPQLSELDNLNMKVKLFNRSYKHSLKIKPSSSYALNPNFNNPQLPPQQQFVMTRQGEPNLLGYLASLEIYSLFMNFSGYFNDSQKNDLNQRLSLLYQDMYGFLINGGRGSVSMQLVSVDESRKRVFSNDIGAGSDNVVNSSPYVGGGANGSSKRTHLENQVNSSFM